MLVFSIVRGARQLGSIVACVAVLAVLALSGSAGAADSSIAQGFKSQDTNVTAASLVAIKLDDANTVELSNLTSNDRLVGIVGTKPLIELSGGGIVNVQVVTSGMTAALVSDINGDIVNGDKITTSPIEGVGMKATSSTVVVGVAQGDLRGVFTKTQTITDKEGKQQTVKIGLLPVQVGVAYYTTGGGNPYIPEPIQNLADAVAGKNVSPVRVIVAGFILMLMFVSVTALLYSAIRAGVISIGRNPLSEGAVRKSLAGVGRTMLAVFVFTILAVYLVLAV